jgi:putative DNA primase/helicase
MRLTSDQARAYFEARLSGQALTRSGSNLAARCPFHEDRHASLSLNFEKAAWNCHAGCGSGGVAEFEKKFSGCDDETARANIGGICGIPNRGLFEQEPEKIYRYRDENGRVLFEKLRFAGKRFSQRALGEDGRRVYDLSGVRRVLYNLPEVVTANWVVICEGEKDADNVAALNLASFDTTGVARFATTTNFDGAGKWRPEYGPYFTGKHAVILPDNDAIGKAHARLVAESVAPYAVDVRVVDLPGLAEKGDVSDFLKDNTARQLLDEIRHTPRWNPPREGLLVPAPHFVMSASPEIDWLVEGVIQRGANGFICSQPKTGKSWLAADLVLALALGEPWVGFSVPRAIKAALITREDNPALTKWRMRHLLAGRGRTPADLEGRLYVNSREQSPEFRLDSAELMAPMIAELKHVEPEFVILDVFNILHSADENDNTEMRGVLEQVNRLQREVGCAIGVVHHFNKNAEGSLTQRIRGSSAIAGWAEWLIGVEVEPSGSGTRRMQFELKAANSPDELCWAICGSDSDAITVERSDWVPKKAGRRRASEILDMEVGA